MEVRIEMELREKFLNDGFVRIEGAFPRQLAEECVRALWKVLPVDPDDPSTWTSPVIRIADMDDACFRAAANTRVLHEAFDELVGREKWLPRTSLGSFPIRFPSKDDPGDTGWHVDASFPGDDVHDYMNWRINRYSRSRALLMLFLFSDVADEDAPTRIRKGSHKDVAKLLESQGEAGLSFMELAQQLEQLPEREEVLATGEAGTVYLCHPFLVHAAQAHKGTRPKFMAQPPLLPRE